MMKNLIRLSELVDRQLQEDPELREYWARTAFARAVAKKVIAYRVAHNLSQTKLAKILGMGQSAVARLEAGEHNPSWETIQLLSGRLGITFFFGVTPSEAHLDWLPAILSEIEQRAPSMEKISSPETGTEAFVAASTMATKD